MPTDRPADAAPLCARCFHRAADHVGYSLECRAIVTQPNGDRWRCSCAGFTTTPAPPEREAAPPIKHYLSFDVSHTQAFDDAWCNCGERWPCAGAKIVPREAAKPLFHDRAEALRQEKAKELAALGERRKRAEAAFWHVAESMDPKAFATYDGAGKALKALWNALDGQGG